MSGHGVLLPIPDDPRRHRLRLVSGTHWIEGTWTAENRKAAEEVALEWARKWWRYSPVEGLAVEDGQT